MRKEYDQWEKEQAEPKKPGPASEAEKQAQKEKIKDDPKTKPPGVQYTPSALLNVMKVPFQVGGAVTGFHFDPIPKENEKAIADAAAATLREFGFGASEKYIHLTVLVSLYGTACLTWVFGYFAHQREKVEKAKKEKAKHENKTRAKDVDNK